MAKARDNEVKWDKESTQRKIKTGQQIWTAKRYTMMGLDSTKYNLIILSLQA